MELPPSRHFPGPGDLSRALLRVPLNLRREEREQECRHEADDQRSAIQQDSLSSPVSALLFLAPYQVKDGLLHLIVIPDEVEDYLAQSFRRHVCVGHELFSL
jgi:hypothetical protein